MVWTGSLCLSLVIVFCMRIVHQDWITMQAQRSVTLFQGVDGSSNTVRTSKYTLLTFLPLNLWEQFHSPSNVYFIILIIMQCVPQISVTNGVPYTAVPFTFILALGAARDLWEDMKKKNADLGENQLYVSRPLAVDLFCLFPRFLSFLSPSSFPHTGPTTCLQIVLLRCAVATRTRPSGVVLRCRCRRDVLSHTHVWSRRTTRFDRKTKSSENGGHYSSTTSRGRTLLRLSKCGQHTGRFVSTTEHHLLCRRMSPVDQPHAENIEASCSDQTAIIFHFSQSRATKYKHFVSYCDANPATAITSELRHRLQSVSPLRPKQKRHMRIWGLLHARTAFVIAASEIVSFFEASDRFWREFQLEALHRG